MMPRHDSDKDVCCPCEELHGIEKDNPQSSIYPKDYPHWNSYSNSGNHEPS